MPYVRKKVGVTMKVLINNELYEMNRKQLRGVLKAASSLIPFGIYAVQKDDVCELRKDKFDNADGLKKAVLAYKEKGFKVYYNEQGGRQS